MVLAAALIAACTAAPADDEASSEAANTAARAPLLAPTWTTCWVEKDTSTNDTFFQAHTVKCRYDAPDDEQPVHPKAMIVEVHDARSDVKTADLFAQPGVDVAVKRVGNDRFPLKLYVHTYGDDFEKVGLERAGVLDARVQIATVDANPKERPLEIKQPFDLWPVTVIQKTSFYSLQLERTPISIAPWVFGQSVDAKSDGFMGGYAIGREQGAVATHHFIAPKQGGLAAKYHGDAEVAVRIDAPGIYVAEANGLRKATDEETGAVPPSAGAGSSSGSSSPDASTPPAPAPSPECGVEGKKCCGGSSGNGFGGTCSEGSFCMAGGNKCVACGDPSEKCCGGPSNNGYNGTCNAGSFCMNGGNSCVSCGNPGEKCCGGPSNNGYNGTCNAGSFCMNGGNSCVSCGKPGEECCGGPNNNGYNGTCDPGATCKAGGNVCVAN
jgi:hypothetical protein